MITGKIERRPDGTFRLNGRPLVPTDVIEVDVPTLGWRRGRFALSRTGTGERPVIAFLDGKWLDPFLYAVDARWPVPS